MIINVYEALEALKELKNNGSTAELVTDPSLFLFPPEDNGNETEEDDGGDITRVPDKLSPDQLLSRAEVELGEIRSSDQVRLEILNCSVWNNILEIRRRKASTYV